MIAPRDFNDMTELRAAIDVLDARMVALLKERADLVTRAAEIKPAAGLPARIDTRIEEVVANVRAHATQAGLDPELVDAIWRQLIEWAIRREEDLMAGQPVPPDDRT